MDNWLGLAKFSLRNENRRGNAIAEIFRPSVDAVDVAFITEAVLAKKDMHKLVEEREHAASRSVPNVGNRNRKRALGDGESAHFVERDPDGLESEDAIGLQGGSPLVKRRMRGGAPSRLTLGRDAKPLPNPGGDIVDVVVERHRHGDPRWFFVKVREKFQCDVSALPSPSDLQPQRRRFCRYEARQAAEVVHRLEAAGWLRKVEEGQGTTIHRRNLPKLAERRSTLAALLPRPHAVLGGSQPPGDLSNGVAGVLSSPPEHVRIRCSLDSGHLS